MDHIKTDYTGLKGSNINTFWLRYIKHGFIADACNYNQMMMTKLFKTISFCAVSSEINQ